MSFGQVYLCLSSCSRWGLLRSGGWVITGGTLYDHGAKADGTVWAIVQWNNQPTGNVANFCGNLDVQINSVSQPSISGPGTILLCGTNTLAINAAVSSTAFVASYTWLVTGNGISPTGTVNTTGPQLNLSYSNWAAGSSLSATVAVGVKHVCGYTTNVTPLITQTFPGPLVFPAIPRSAWVQLSPGNIEDLKVPFSFSPVLICGQNAQMVVSNPPAGATLSWSSSNPSGLTVSNSGYATRISNFNNSITVYSTASNLCGSYTQSTEVWIGIPSLPGTISGDTAPNTGSIYNYVVYPAPQGAPTYNWLMPNDWSWWGGGGGYINTLTPNLLVGSLAGRLQVYGINNCGNGPVSTLRVYPQAGPCIVCPRYSMDGKTELEADTTFAKIAVYPNPTSTDFKVRLKTPAEHPGELLLIDQSGLVWKSLPIAEGDQHLTMSINEIAGGLYYLQINDGVKSYAKKVMIRH